MAGSGQGGASLHLASGRELLVEPGLQLLADQAVEGGFQGCGRCAPLLQLLYQLFNVVGLAGAAQQVGAGLPLAHPEVGPAQRQLTLAPALDWPIHPQ